MKKIIPSFLAISLTLAVGACSNNDSSTASSSSTTTDTYSRSATPTELSVSVPGSMSASTLGTSSRSIARTAEVGSSGPCSDITQTGASQIENNRVSIGCSLLGGVTKLLGKSIMTGDLYMNILDAGLAEGTITESSSCTTMKGTMTQKMYNSMETIGKKLGLGPTEHTDKKDNIGKANTFAYKYSTSPTDSDFTHQFQIADSCSNISSATNVTTYMWNDTTNVLSVGFDDSSQKIRGVFTYNPANDRSTYRVTNQGEVQSPDGSTDNTTNSYTVSMKQCNSSESSTTNGTCAVIKINMAIIAKGVFPSDFGNPDNSTKQALQGKSKTNSVSYFGEGKADDSGVYLKGTYQDYTYALDNRTNLIDQHAWLYEGSWNKTGITFVKQNMDGGAWQTYPSAGAAPSAYSQNTYAASANTLTVNSVENLKPGSYIVVKDNSSNPNLLPEKVIGAIERSPDNYTSDAWDNSSNSKIWVWDPADKQFEQDNTTTVNLQ